MSNYYHVTSITGWAEDTGSGWTITLTKDDETRRYLPAPEDLPAAVRQYLLAWLTPTVSTRPDGVQPCAYHQYTYLPLDGDNPEHLVCDCP